MKLPDFESPFGDSLSKSANFGLSKWIFYVRNHPNLSKKNFIEKYQFSHTSFVKSIFCWFQFLNHFITKMTSNFWWTIWIQHLSRHRNQSSFSSTSLFWRCFLEWLQHEEMWMAHRPRFKLLRIDTKYDRQWVW